MVKVVINGEKEVEVEKDTMLLNVLRENGVYVPTLCHDDRLEPYGSCRMCVVEVIKRGKSKVVTSCNYPVSSDIEVRTDTDKIKNYRKLNLELLLSRAPNSEVVNELASQYGVEKSRFPVKDENCIMCGLCVRVCNEVVGAGAITFAGRGVGREVTTPFKIIPDQCIDCMECAKVCPTGRMELVLKEYSEKKVELAQGHRLCAGCAEPVVVKQVLMAIDKPKVVANATGCLEVSTTIYPYTSWKVPWIHTAFENAGATISGVEAAYKALKNKGVVEEDIVFVAFAGDGGSYDIGFQSISGAMERGHNIIFVTLNNEAYMNTGIQRSSATPFTANTTTTPAGKVIPGKKEFPKDLTEIMVAHSIPYVAQISPSNVSDTLAKVKRAADVNGPAFLNAISTCPRGWRSDTSKSIELTRVAVETCYWPLYEVVNGQYRLTSTSKLIAEGKMEKKPLIEWLKPQRRFRHIMKNEELLNKLQEELDRKWERLLELTGYS